MLRYAANRGKLFQTRIGISFCAALLLAVILGPVWPTAVFLAYVSIDGAETWFLLDLPKRMDAGISLARARVISAIYATLTSLCICAFAVIPVFGADAFQGGQSLIAELFFAICAILGPALAASLDYRYNALAGIMRLAVFSALPVGLMALTIFSGRARTVDVELLLAGLLGYFMAQIWFLILAQRRHRNVRRALRSQALQRQALEDAYMRLFDQKQEARRLAMIAEHANDGVMLIDGEGRIHWVNDGFTRMTGFSFDELVGGNAGEILNSSKTDPAALREIEEGRAAGKAFRTELINRRKDGKDIWIETNQVPVFDEAGRVEIYISVERDVTAAKSHEKQLQEARLAAEEGARTKEEFLATMSHEFRTPMNGVIGMAQMLLATDLSEDQRLYTDTILSSSRALLALINDVLDLSRMTAAGVSLHKVEFDLHACIRDTTLLMSRQAADKGLMLEMVIEEDVPEWVIGDDRRLRQILINLVGNALKFTSNGGVEIRVSATTGVGTLSLSVAVRDSGIGIAEDKLDHIFERFSQADTAISRRYGGTGLGLSISRGLARAMGGDISVASRLGEGSCFTLCIDLEPVCKADQRSHIPQDHPEPVELTGLAGLKLLVAEDNRVNRLLISKFLADTPLQLYFATDGAEAEALAHRYRPQVILMDMSMPEVNGLEATQAIRRLDIPQPYIAALTANVDDTSRQACLDAGMDAFLSKPLSRQELLTLLIRFSESVRESESS
ncbi:ATP-binding protein [Phaeobacter sp. B1627]|uniref:PAS domain-containing hybrid sensor histidine kinase/response regulator n=1 Tax=Phaeobacter sp. B1627 TaxID=2583809 RepID=UPI0021042B28|nr:ATP-binding protein [Phaeobacter sp. B1627]